MTFVTTQYLYIHKESYVDNICRVLLTHVHLKKDYSFVMKYSSSNYKAMSSYIV